MQDPVEMGMGGYGERGKTSGTARRMAVTTEWREDSRERSQVGAVVASTGAHLWVAPYKAIRVCADR